MLPLPSYAILRIERGLQERRKEVLGLEMSLGDGDAGGSTLLKIPSRCGGGRPPGLTLVS